MRKTRNDRDDARRRAIRRFVLIAGSLFWALACEALAQALPSWNEGPAKQAIVRFVASVTTQGAGTFVAPDDRIAVFDNDGTLWPEQPLPFQLVFALDRIRAKAPQHPEWRNKEPFESILAGDLKTALAGGETSVAELLAVTHAGMTTDAFKAQVDEWLATARHPRFKRPYTDLAYQPMLELLGFLRDNGFKTFIVSGGGIEFMRPWTQKVYGIPPEQVIGSQGRLAFQMRGKVPVLVKLPQIDFVDNGPGKPIGIQKLIGLRPLAAFGNPDGDLQMLQWTMAGSGQRFALLIHHTDAQREWAYDRTSSAGSLAKALDEAQANGWTIVDMRRDWKKVFAFE